MPDWCNDHNQHCRYKEGVIVVNLSFKCNCTFLNLSLTLRKYQEHRQKVCLALETVLYLNTALQLCAAPSNAMLKEMEYICFEIIHPESAPGEYGSKDHPSPYVHLLYATEQIPNMVAPDEIVISKREIRVLASYPLAQKHVIPVSAPEGKAAFTRADVAEVISRLYHWIYAEEHRTSKTITTSLGGYNRAPRQGRFGIWGHSLGDLSLTEVCYNKEDDVYELVIES